MKILQINAVNSFGSTGGTCRELAEAVNKTGEHSCYTAFSVGTQDAYSYRIGNKFNAKLHGLLSRLTGKQGHFSKRDTKKLIAWMDELKPDVVQLRNLHANYIHLPMLLEYLAREDIPTVVTLHDCWFFTGKCCHYTMDGCMKWQTGCHHCPRLKKDNKSWFVDATKELWIEKKRLFEAIPRLAVTGVSQWAVDAGRKSFLRCAKQITRIYNWIDLEVFKPQGNTSALREKIAPKGRNVVLGVASAWSSAKGLDGFIKLAKLLGEEYTVCLVGNMPAGVTLPDNLYHIPATETAGELAQLYSMADVFVTLSAEETFGKVTAEALACGTPVICYDSTANKELVGDGCGAVHKLGDLSAVAESVKEICAKDKFEVYTQICCEFARKNFNKEDRIRDYLDLYEKIGA